MERLLIGLLGVLLLLGACTPAVETPVAQSGIPPVEGGSTPEKPMVIPTQVPDGNVEAQASYTSWDPLGTTWTRLGQILTIPDRRVKSLSFHLGKIGVISGDVIFTIRDLDDNIILSKVWGDASEVPEKSTWLEVTFNNPVTINEEVRVSCEWEGKGDADNCLQYSYRTGDKKPGECYTNYRFQWHDIGEAEEGNYKYTFGR